MASKSRGYNYYDAFIKMAEYSCEAAKMLVETVDNYCSNELKQKLVEMHRIENAADKEKHVLITHLVKEFITPIEREDIILLAQKIDDVTDAIEDVMLRMYMFNIKTLRKEAADFAKTIYDCCQALKESLVEFPNFKKSKKLHDLIVQVNNLEEHGDKVYIEAVRDLYVTSTDPIEISAWNETFFRFEKCCDACENVSDTVESIVMKNN